MAKTTQRTKTRPLCSKRRTRVACHIVREEQPDAMDVVATPRATHGIEDSDVHDYDMCDQANTQQCSDDTVVHEEPVVVHEEPVVVHEESTRDAITLSVTGTLGQSSDSDEKHEDTTATQPVTGTLGNSSDLDEKHEDDAIEPHMQSSDAASDGNSPSAAEYIKFCRQSNVHAVLQQLNAHDAKTAYETRIRTDALRVAGCVWYALCALKNRAQQNGMSVDHDTVAAIQLARFSLSSGFDSVAKTVGFNVQQLPALTKIPDDMATMNVYEMVLKLYEMLIDLFTQLTDHRRSYWVQYFTADPLHNKRLRVNEAVRDIGIYDAELKTLHAALHAKPWFKQLSDDDKLNLLAAQWDTCRTMSGCVLLLSEEYHAGQYDRTDDNLAERKHRYEPHELADLLNVTMHAMCTERNRYAYQYFIVSHVDALRSETLEKMLIMCIKNGDYKSAAQLVCVCPRYRSAFCAGHSSLTPGELISQTCSDVSPKRSDVRHWMELVRLVDR